MNNTLLPTLIVWRTRNERRQKAVERLCKDYGLLCAMKGAWVGKLSAKERAALQARVRTELSKRTDSLLAATVCASCFDSLTVSDTMKGVIMTPPKFELVQVEIPKMA